LVTVIPELAPAVASARDLEPLAQAQAVLAAQVVVQPVPGGPEEDVKRSVPQKKFKEPVCCKPVLFCW
jgi:hypothetical protein